MNMFSGYEVVANASSSERVAFIRRTYSLLGLAVLAFVGLEVLMFQSGVADTIMKMVSGRGAWIAVMVLFMAGGFVAQSLANSQSSPNIQYAGLALEVILWAVMFVPILWIAEFKFPGKQIPLQAGILTLVIFGGLTLSVFISGRDFSFMGTALTVLGFASLAMVIIAVVMGINLGLWFSFAMVALACGYIIYDTSNIMHRYHSSQHVAAAVALFGSVMLLFYYILRIFMAREE